MPSHTFDPKAVPMPADYICRKFDLSRTTLWRWRRAGLPTQRVGAKIFILERDVVTFMERMNGQKVNAAPLKSESRANI